MDTILTTAQSMLDTLLKMPSVLIFALALNVIGWTLSKVPLFPRKRIPIVIIMLSGTAMPLLLAHQPCGEMSPYISNPQAADLIRRVGIGLIVGFIAWGLHKSLLGRLEKWLPGFKDETTIATKPKE